MSGIDFEVPRAVVLEFLEAAVRQAQLDAERVVRFLERVGFVPGPRQRAKKPCNLPRAFLLQIAAAVRISDWELSGVAQKPLAELPSSEEVLASAFTSLGELLSGALNSEPDPTTAKEVFIAWHRNFALNGPRDLGVNVVVDGIAPRESMELIADFLWRFRHLARESRMALEKK